MARSIRAQRGSALLLVIIALAILAIIGLAAVEFTGRDLGMARTTQRKNAIDRCASAARRFLQAQYRVTGGGVPNAKLLVALNAQGGDPTVQFVPNMHYGGLIQPLPTPYTQSMLNQRGDRTNTIVLPATPEGSTFASVICRELTPQFPDGGGRESEFEFVLQPTL